MRLKGTEELISSGWVGGIVEDAEPSDGYRKSGFTMVPVGIMDACTNFVRTTDGRLAVRNGSQAVVQLDDGLGTNASSVLAIQRYSQDGAVLVFYEASAGVHFAALYSGDLQTRVVSAATNLAWNKTPNDPPARPRVVELFEKLYIGDATRALADRQPLVALDAAGTKTAVLADFGSGSEAVRPYALAVYNNVLFISGQDAGQVNAPAMVRHSFLGKPPENADGFDPEAYATIGAAGEFITAMVPGRSILLIAKENELYRLSGFGRALEGWQYAVQPIENTDYVGVKHPGAMCFAEGYWYGVGESGPFRTDGLSIEMLVRPRLRSWRNVTALDQAVVRYDPTRRAILFGLVTGNATAINTVWLWDIDAEQWMADWLLPVAVNDIYALATQGLAGPDAAPSSLTIDHTQATLSSVTGSFTTGDTTAKTNVWVDKGTGFVLALTLNPNVTTFTIPGLPNSAKCPVKVEHIKNGISSGFTGVVYGYTVLAAPTLEVTGTGANSVNLSATQQANGADLVLKRDGTTIKTWVAQPSGTLPYADTGRASSTTYTYTLYSTRADWPASLVQSATVTAQATTGASNITPPGSPVFDHSQATASTCHFSFTPGDASLPTEVWVNHGSGFTFLTQLAAGVTTYTVSFLNANTALPVELRHKDPATGSTSLFSAIGTGYTTLTAPTLASPTSDHTSITVNVTVPVRANLTLKRDGTTIATWSNVLNTQSKYDSGLACSNGYTYTASFVAVDWPAQLQQSPTATSSFSTAECGGGGGGV